MRASDPIGRGQWLERLSPLPRVALLRSPPSTGKRTTALWAAAREAAPVDIRFWPATEMLDEYGRVIDSSDEHALVMSRREPPLSAEMVREIVSWSRTSPLTTGRVKVAIVRVSHTTEAGEEWVASQALFAALLKTLEEPPSKVRFVLLATRPAPTMIRSRATEILGGLLSETALTEVLDRVTDLSPEAARAAAALGGGRVAQAVRAGEASESSISAVVDVLTCLVAKDQIALAEKSRAWTDGDTAMLLLWAHERLTGRWRVFSGSGAPELSQLAAKRVLGAVSRVRDARPRIVLGAVAALAEA